MAENYTQVWLWSFIFWCSIVAFQLYLNMEHYYRSRYWQMGLGGCLMLSAVFRMAFFALKWQLAENKFAGDTEMHIPEAISRLAFLLQATALSILFNLWFYFMLLQVKGLPGARESMHAERASYYGRLRLCFIIFNIGLYIGILSTVSKTDSETYVINIFIVTFFELLQSLFLLVMACLMGLIVIAEAIRKTSDDATFQKFDNLPLFHKLSYLYKMAFNESYESSFYIRERVIINSLLSMSLCICLIFLIRFVVMLVGTIHNQIENGNNDDYSFKTYNLIVYPWFFYQIPDFLLYFILGFNISPSDGIYHRTIRPCLNNFLCLPFCPRNTLVLRETVGNKSVNIGDSDLVDESDVFTDLVSSTDSCSVTMSPMSQSESSTRRSENNYNDHPKLSTISSAETVDHYRQDSKIANANSYLNAGGGMFNRASEFDM